MSRVGHIVLGTPVVLRFGKILQEKRLGQFAELPLHVIDPLAVLAQEQFRQIGRQIAAEHLFVLLRQAQRPRTGIGRHGPERREQTAPVGFVGENTLDRRTDPLAAVLPILFVRQLDEPFRRFRIENVQIGRPVVHVRLGACPLRELEHRLAGIVGHVRRGIQALQVRVIDPVQIAGESRNDPLVVPLELLGGHRLQNKILHPQRRIYGHHAPGAARRPTVLIVQVSLHAEPCGLVHDGVRQIEPLGPEILGLQADARVQECPAHAHFLEHMELTDQLVFLETAVPRPEGLAPPLVAGIAERSVKRIVGQRRRLFGAIASAAGQQHDGRNGRP